MKFERCIINDSYVIEPEVFGDNRGFFLETYNENKKYFNRTGNKTVLRQV